MEPVRIVSETESFLVVRKPAGLHSAPLGEGEEHTLLSRVLELYPEIASVPGLKPVEPGLLHRLDRDTSGLVLIARTRDSWNYLRDEALQSRFAKRYTAVCVDLRCADASRIRYAVPDWPFTGTLMRAGDADYPGPGDGLSSCFRAYGPGRRRIAPAACGESRGPETKPYVTSVLDARRIPETESGQPLVRFRVELVLGFRHQIRCHLAACGLPIAGDPLYSPRDTFSRFSRLHLYADGLTFRSPETGETVEIDEDTVPELP